MAFEVVGVMDEKVQMSNYNRPDKYCVFIPYTTMAQLADTAVRRHVRLPGGRPDAASRRRRGRCEASSASACASTRPTSARSASSARSQNTQEITGGITTGLKLVLTFIGVLTLAIGGVGIMNIMFVSVKERTREIGMRKALGARRRAILLQFLLEGLATTFAGGAVGVVAVLRAGAGCSARGRSSPSCSTTSPASTDIHLVLSLPSCSASAPAS